MKKLFTSLTFKISATILAVEIAILCGIGLFYIKRFHQEIDSKLRVNAEIPGKLISSGILERDALTDRRMISTLIGQDLVDAFVLDRNLNILTALNPANQGKHIKELNNINPEWFSHSSNEIFMVEMADSKEKQLLSVVPKLSWDGVTPVEYIYVRVNTDQAATDKQQIVQLFVLGSLAAILLTTLMLIYVFRFLVINRIAKTKTALERIEKNDYTVMISPIRSQDELSVLQQQVNSMMAVLQGTFENLTLEVFERSKAENEIKQQQMKLRQLTSELSLAEERQRRNIASGLHDELGALLVSANIKLNELQKDSRAFDREKLQEIREHLDGAIEFTRSLTLEISPPVLYELGLEAAIQWLLNKNKADYGLDYTYEDGHLEHVLEDDVAVLLFQSTRELLFNIVKHAKSKKVNVTIQTVDDQLKLTVEDYGVGFDSDSIKSDYTNSGYGLFNIRERLTYIGGKISIHSVIGQGTKIQLYVPVTTVNE